MSNEQQVDWITRRLATPVGLRSNYVTLPAFSMSGISWLGASQIVTQFNFSATKNFTIPLVPASPVDLSYCLCIRYRIGDTVTRYKLWDMAGSTLAEVPLYGGEVIKKNFVLEVWSIDGITTAGLDEAVDFTLSIRTVPTDYRDISASLNATGAQFSALENTNTAALPTTGLVWRFDAAEAVVSGSDVITWPDNILPASRNLVNNGIGLPTYTAEVDELGSKPCVNFTATASMNDAGANVDTALVMFVVAKIDSGVVDDEMVAGAFGKFKFDNLVANRAAYNYATGLEIETSGSVTGQWNIFMCRTTALSSGTRPRQLLVTDRNATLYDVTGNTNQALLAPGIIQFGEIGNAALFSVAEVLGYSTVADVDAVISYLSNKYAIGLPLTFDTGGQWLDNE